MLSGHVMTRSRWALKVYVLRANAPQDRRQPVVIVLEQRGDRAPGLDEVIALSARARACGRANDGGQQFIAGDLVGEQQRAKEIVVLGKARQFIVGAFVDAVV